MEHITMDGRRVHISAPEGLDVSGLLASWGKLIVPAGTVHCGRDRTSWVFGIDKAGFSYAEGPIPTKWGDWKVTPVGEFGMETGLLRLGYVHQPAHHGMEQVNLFAVLESKFFSLQASFFDTEMPEKVVDCFSRLQIEESSLGMSLRKHVDPTKEIRYIKLIPEFAVIDISSRGGPAEAQIPKSAGLAVPGGELFRTKDDASGLMMVSDTAITRVSRVPDNKQTREEFAGTIADLSVSVSSN